MITLSNVNPPEERVISSSVRLAPDAFPEAKSSKTGVSVRYVQDPNKSWYVFRASYGRVDKASDFLVEDGTYTYVAKRYVRRYVHRRIKRILEPLIPNLLFAYTTKEKANAYISDTPALSYLTYYYNHFEFNEQHRNPPLLIPDGDMIRFINETKTHDEHLVFIEYSECHFKLGEKVRVIAGAFKDVEGHVVRISGQQRVAVNIRGLGTVATAYIPSAFLERIV